MLTLTGSLECEQGCVVQRQTAEVTSERPTGISLSCTPLMYVGCVLQQSFSVVMSVWSGGGTASVRHSSGSLLQQLTGPESQSFRACLWHKQLPQWLQHVLLAADHQLEAPSSAVHAVLCS